MFVKIFHHYLFGQQFTFNTDHGSLQWVMRFFVSDSLFIVALIVCVFSAALLYLPFDVMWLLIFCFYSSQCCGLVCSVWLWHVLVNSLTFFVWFLLCRVVLSVLSCFVIILLVAVSILFLFLAVSLVGVQCVIMVFPGHNKLLFAMLWCDAQNIVAYIWQSSNFQANNMISKF